MTGKQKKDVGLEIVCEMQMCWGCEGLLEDGDLKEFVGLLKCTGVGPAKD